MEGGRKEWREGGRSGGREEGVEGGRKEWREGRRKRERGRERLREKVQSEEIHCMYFLGTKIHLTALYSPAEQRQGRH